MLISLFAFLMKLLFKDFSQFKLSNNEADRNISLSSTFFVNEYYVMQMYECYIVVNKAVRNFCIGQVLLLTFTKSVSHKGRYPNVINEQHHCVYREVLTSPLCWSFYQLHPGNQRRLKSLVYCTLVNCHHYLILYLRCIQEDRLIWSVFEVKNVLGSLTIQYNLKYNTNI